ncbi:hypothetical protein BDZ89DRAFT_1157096 [Hymenopellis radicata]|nr:hypothetical protein BDZ89DRAFT_1157096 [Hymenopellis radicata]
MSLGLQDLLVELLYHTQLLALPPINLASFDSSPNSFHVQYITRRIVTDPIDWPPNLFSKLPKHLFRRLDARKRVYADTDEPLPFLRLFEANPAPSQRQCPPRIRVNDGHARFLHSARALPLQNGRETAAKDAIAVIVGINKKDLNLVRMLVEPEQKSSSKRQWIPDRLRYSEGPEMLKVAITVNARDYLRDQGIWGDLQNTYHGRICPRSRSPSPIKRYTTPPHNPLMAWTTIPSFPKPSICPHQSAIHHV